MRLMWAVLVAVTVSACTATVPPPVEVRGRSPIIVDPTPDPTLPPGSTVIVPR